MATPSAQMNLNGLARKLVNDGLLSDTAALNAQEQAAKKKKPLVSYLVEEKLVDSGKIASAAAEEFGVPLFDLDVIDLEKIGRAHV